MRLQEAIAASAWGSAKIPYYRNKVSPRMAKSIIMKPSGDAYVIWDDTQRYLHELDMFDYDKCRGRDDWEPVN
jgi:hypothetical protein